MGGGLIDPVFLGETIVRLLGGMPLTLALAATSVASGLVLAMFLAVLRRSSQAGSWFVRFYVWLFRGSPLLVQLFLIYYGLSQFPAIRQSFLWTFLRQPFWCAILALALNTASYASEIIRGGLESVPRGAVADLVLSRVASIGVSGPFSARYDALERVAVGSFPMVPVAAPDHPLSAPPPGDHAPGAARHHIQLVVYDRSARTAGHDFSVAGHRTWRLADLASKHMLLKAGIGWGMMPWWMVAKDIEAGRLVQLDLPDQVAFDYRVDVIYRTDTPPGPAAAWLMERFRRQVDPSTSFD